MIQAGDIILTHTPFRSWLDVIPWLIRKITKSHWNHVAWAINPDFAIEAQGGYGVRTIPIGKYTSLGPNYFCIVRIHPDFLLQENLEKALKEARACEGKNYDWWLIFQLLWLYLMGSRKTKEAGDWDNSWICSELVAKPLWKCAGFIFTEKIPVDNIVPADIRRSDRVFWLFGGKQL